MIDLDPRGAEQLRLVFDIRVERRGERRSCRGCCSSPARNAPAIRAAAGWLYSISTVVLVEGIGRRNGGSWASLHKERPSTRMRSRLTLTDATPPRHDRSLSSRPSTSASPSAASPPMSISPNCSKGRMSRRTARWSDVSRRNHDAVAAAWSRALAPGPARRCASAKPNGPIACRRLELDEIDAAVTAVRARGLDLADIGREDFPLPTLGPVLDRLRGEVLDGRGFVMMRGMRVEDRPIAESATAYWGVGAYFGSARSQNGKGHLLGHVYDLGQGLSATNPHLRSYATAERQKFHIDRCDVVALLCLRRAKSGRAVDDRQLDGGAQRDGGAPARSAGAAVPAVPRRPPRRSAGRQGAVLRSAGVQPACRHTSRCCIRGCISVRRSVSRRRGG